jgi:glutamate/tyrosine decarboxylase-like PLP-dependent enzyme
MNMEALKNMIVSAREKNIRYFILVLNMSTTMFGSVDDVDTVTGFFETEKLIYRLHIDAAFGGFIYPFSHPQNPFTFKNPRISSFSIDAHKLLQTPYGTGIFLVRKDLIGHVCTREAQYVPGTDHTLCGSRSGANAIAVWMVLHNYGSEGWKNKIGSLIGLTTEICNRLDEMQIRYYRNPYMNIITIRATDIDPQVAEKYFLVADSYESAPRWWKIVVMPHLTRGMADRFFQELSVARKKNNTA